MNKMSYFNFIEEKMSSFVSRVKVRGKLNLLDIHGHSENFYADFLNLLYDWKLKNVNTLKANVEAIDLVDRDGLRVAQVSATGTKAKLNDALSKLKDYRSYGFKFIPIQDDCQHLKGKPYDVPEGVSFDSEVDIFDLVRLLRDVKDSDTPKQKNVYLFLKKELVPEFDLGRLETNLADLVNILSEKDLSLSADVEVPNGFGIDEKISFNDLKGASLIIRDHALYHSFLNRVYTEFDLGGMNKSISVLSAVRSIYAQNKSSLSGDDLFWLVIEGIKERVGGSLNFKEIRQEQLDLCAQIIAVDAFVRCKIFENPSGYQHAAS